jgi:phosphoenolpyruvate-protein phosphotransferase
MTQMSNGSLQFVFSCPLASGIHARPASYLAEVANQFAAESTLTNLRNGLTANAKSVLGIISSDIRNGDRCSLHVSGSDEHAAHAALRRFVDETLPRCDVPLASVADSNAASKLPRALQAANATCLFGKPISRGLAQGKVLILRRMTLPREIKSDAVHNPQHELERIKDAVSAVRHRIGEKLKYSLTPTGTAVLQADLAMAGDVFLVLKLNEQILRGKSAAQAVVEAGEFFIDLLGHSENEYIRQRSADVEEICLQLLEEVNGTRPAASTVALREPSVLVAETLGPQQLLELDRRWLKALVIEHSAATSHAAILARSLGIPTIAGVRNARLALTPGGEVVVDANRGFVIPNISAAVKRFYERERETLRRRKESWAGHAEKSATTADGNRVEVAANVSSGEEMSLGFANGADGIGLFRTEMIYLGREDAPSEEEQFAIYSEAARLAGNKPVIIRTFDIGGDKKVPYLNLPHEENPFLGFRGARIYAEHRDLLHAQLRAILRASAVGNLQIMAPMISSVEEIVQFKAEIALARHSLLSKGIDFRSDVKIGMMIEVPSVAFILEQLSIEVDFFSIGTNDLAQYFFAADRGNPKIASLFSVRHPSFLRLLEQIVEQIHHAGKWVGVCGEMAADVRSLPFLLGLGVDEISVPAAEVHDLKRAVASLRASDCIHLLDEALACRDGNEVEDLLAAETFRAPVRSLLSDELIVLGSTSQNKEEVIQEMIDALYISGRADDRQQLEEALWAREAMGSTSLGYGFAIPHCKTDAVTANSICVLRLKQPILWDAGDKEPVHMVVLLAVRESDAASTHMQVFSSLARKLVNDDFRQHLLKVAAAHEVTSYLAHQLGLPHGQTSERPITAERPVRN